MSAILRGKQILDRVRVKTKDSNYYSYDEINEAQSWLEKYAPFNYLRKSNILGAGLREDTKEYDLNLADVRRIEAIWIGQAETTSVGDIEGITLSGTDPVSIQITAHGLTTGREIIPSSVGGTTEINDNIYKITKTDADNFTLQGTDSSNFTAWTSGGEVAVYDVDDDTWVMMEEAPSRFFEERVKSNTNITNNVTTGTVVVTTTEVQTNRTTAAWTYYLKAGDNNVSMKMVVSPIPSTTYRIKIDYLKNPTTISEDIIPDIPVSYYDMLINMSAGFILERSDKEGDRQLAGIYQNKARNELFKMVNDTHANRSMSIDRPLAEWKI
jgi:hypothetical protein